MTVPSTTCTRAHIPEIPCECGFNARTPGTSDTASNKLTDADYDRLVITQARQRAAVLRASDSARDRLDGHLMTELADRAERQGGGDE